MMHRPILNINVIINQHMIYTFKNRTGKLSNLKNRIRYVNKKHSLVGLPNGRDKPSERAKPSTQDGGFTCRPTHHCYSFILFQFCMNYFASNYTNIKLIQLGTNYTHNFPAIFAFVSLKIRQNNSGDCSR